MDQNNYPEMLGKTAIINGGAIINMVFNLVRPFLDSRTQNKIEVPVHPSSPQTCRIHSSRTLEGMCGCPHCLAALKDASDPAVPIGAPQSGEAAPSAAPHQSQVAASSSGILQTQSNKLAL